MPDADEPIILASARRHFEKYGWTDDDIRQALQWPIKKFSEGADRYMLIAFDRSGRLVELGIERAGDVDRMVAFHFFTARPGYVRALGQKG